MNIRCPNCQTVFRIDPAKVPPEGVRAKCSRCAHAFRIAPLGAAGAAAAGAPPTSAMPGAGLAQPATSGAATTVGPPATPPAAGSGVAGAAAPPAAPRPAPAPPPAAPPPQASPAATSATGAAPAPAGGSSRPVFGSRDPKARAQRIARALVSDIVAYNRQRVDETLANGTLRAEFREEILKSWDEYVAQVGAELAKGTPYFRDALNEILARGQRVF